MKKLLILMQVGRLISGEFYHPLCKLLRVALLLLSTWFGTFFMCGRASLSSNFPFFQSFAQVDRTEREKILLLWSFSSFNLYGSFNLYRMLFKCLKYLIVRAYFSEVLYFAK